MMQTQKKTSSTSGIMASLAAGFDLTTKHLWLLLIPILLDLFLWIGPRLGFNSLVVQILEFLPPEADIFDISSQLLTLAPRANLFTSLSVRFIGIPALMVGISPEATPRIPEVIELMSWASFIGAFLLLTVAGLLLTGIYYTFITFALYLEEDEEVRASQKFWTPEIGRNLLRLVGVALVFLLNILIVYFPLIIISSFLFLINQTLGAMALFAGPLFIIWIAIFMSLAPQGVILNGRPPLRAILESFRLVQSNLPQTMLLILFIVFAGTLLDSILLLAETGTWLTIINILGHAFVSTALVTALFIFYRDRYSATFGEQQTIDR